MKIDKKKEKIGLLKFWLGVAVATFLAIAGWIATNIAKAESWLVICGCLSLIGLSISGFLLTRQINKHIDDLEDL